MYILMVAGQKQRSNSIAIDLPEISKLLIIGDSDTAFSFSANLQNIAMFEQIYHVESIFTAVRLLQRNRFAVIVIDVDSDFDVVSCSKIITLSNQLTRIVLISKMIWKEDAVNLKNKGFIHAYLPIPNEDFLVHSIIIKEQAAYRIQKSLIEMIIDPPKNTPLFNLVNQNTPISHIRPHRILGIVIMEETVVKYNLFFDFEEGVDPLLLSSYLSAISLYGKHIFDIKVGEFEGLLFDTVSLLMKSVEDFQYIYLVENLAESKLSEIQKFLRLTTRKIHLKFSSLLTKPIAGSQKDFDSMLFEIKKILKMEDKKPNVLEYEEKPIIINLDLPNELLSDLEEETKRVYHFEQAGSEYQLFDFLKDSDCDLVILNDVSDMESQKPIIASIKTISPSTQIIVSADEISSSFIFDLLNQDEVNYVLMPDMKLDEYFSIVKKAIDHSKRIKRGVYAEDLYEFYVSSNKTEMVKTLLSKIPHSLDKMTFPVLYGIFIMEQGEKFYSNYWIKNEVNIMQNEESFLHFMQALLSFSEDYSTSSIALSLINFGQSKLIVEKHFDYVFIYFIGNLDISNYDFVKEKTRELTTKIHTLIVNNFDFRIEYSINELNESMLILDMKIDQACVETLLTLGSS